MDAHRLITFARREKRKSHTGKLRFLRPLSVFARHTAKKLPADLTRHNGLPSA
jgi:hypothetical protein